MGEILTDQEFLYDLNLAMNTNSAFKKAVDWWEMTGLPMPEIGEYAYSEKGVSVFINPLGLSIHFRSGGLFKGAEYKGYHVVDENILQPLYSFQAGHNSHIEITPGIERSAMKKNALESVVARLEKHGMTMQEKDNGFLGVLPHLGKIVVANRSVVKMKSAKASKLAEPPVLQTKIFGSLAGQMQSAFQSASQEQIQSVFHACREITSLPKEHPEKILHASWTNSATLGPMKKTIIETASAYEKRLG